MSSLFQPTLTAQTDANGNVTFVLDPPTGSGLGVQCMIAILDTGGAGDFYAQIAGGKKWGGWSGSSPFGPVTYAGNQRLTVHGSGLAPSTVYTCEIFGEVDELDQLQPALPSATAQSRGSGASIASNVLDKSNVALGASGASVAFGPFATAQYGGVQTRVIVHAGGPYLVTLEWSAPGGFRIARRTYVVGFSSGAASELEVTNPNLGSNLIVTVQSLHNAGNFDLAVTLLAGPIAAYTSAGPNQTNVVSGQMGIIAAMQSPIGAGATVTFFLPDVMGGPAILDFSPFDQAAGVNITSWSLFVEQTPDLDTGSSAPQPIVSRTSAGDGNRRHTGMIYLPARPTMLSLTSGDAAPRHFDLTLELDRDRVG